MESAAATSPWLPPGGSWHDEISASRNRYFVVTDEGRRWLKVSDFPVKWRKPEHMPLIQLHSFTNLSPPLISLATLSSFPPGEAKGQLRELVPFNALLCSIRKWAAAPLGSPDWRPLRTQKILACSNQRTTPPSARGGAKAASPQRAATSLPYGLRSFWLICNQRREVSLYCSVDGKTPPPHVRSAPPLPWEARALRASVQRM